jgi:hypothetical protein
MMPTREKRSTSLSRCVYIVVDVGSTYLDPASVEVEKLPGEIATDEAFETFHASVDVPAEATIEGEAVKETIEGSVPVGVTLLDAEDEAEMPMAFVADTVNVYDVLFVRPVTTMGLPVELATMLPGLEVAV